MGERKMLNERDSAGVCLCVFGIPRTMMYGRMDGCGQQLYLRSVAANTTKWIKEKQSTEQRTI